MKILKIGAVVLIIAVLLPAASLALRIWDPLWNPFRPEPEKVIEKTIEKMQTLKSFSYDVSAGSDSTQNEIVSSFSLTVKGDVDDKKLSTVFDVTVGALGVSINFGLEQRRIGEESYYKITKVPSIPGLPEGLSSQKDQWIKQEAMATSQLDSIKAILEDKDLYVVQEELKDEDINGKPAYHYILKLDGDKIGKVLEQYSSQGATGNLDVANIALGSLSKVLDNTDIEAWIGKKDYYVYKIKIMADTGNLEANFSNFNQSFNIVPPENFKTQEDFK